MKGSDVSDFFEDVDKVSHDILTCESKMDGSYFALVYLCLLQFVNDL